MWGKAASSFAMPAGDGVTVARRNIKHGHHQDLEALILEAAAIQASHWPPKELDYIAHVFSHLPEVTREEPSPSAVPTV
jgi:hypothetical protein